MHSSRMRTVHCSGLPRRVSAQVGVSAQGDVGGGGLIRKYVSSSNVLIFD